MTIRLPRAQVFTFNGTLARREQPDADRVVAWGQLVGHTLGVVRATAAEAQRRGAAAALQVAGCGKIEIQGRKLGTAEARLRATGERAREAAKKARLDGIEQGKSIGIRWLERRKASDIALANVVTEVRFDVGGHVNNSFGAGRIVGARGQQRIALGALVRALDVRIVAPGEVRATGGGLACILVGIKRIAVV